jgi:hypothetical protein
MWRVLLANTNAIIAIAYLEFRKSVGIGVDGADHAELTMAAKSCSEIM